MKKNRFLWALLLLVSLGAAAQDNIHFVGGYAHAEGIKPEEHGCTETESGANYCPQ